MGDERRRARSSANPRRTAPGTATGADRRPGLVEERRLWKAGHQWVAGVDEVGRGAWAGPISVGVAVVRPGIRRTAVPRWLRDSKMLAEERREAIFDEVAGWCAAWAVGHASAAECDEWGMTAAQRLAAHRALAGLSEPPDAVLVDGPYDFVRHRPLPGPVAEELPLTGGAAGPLRPAEPFPLPEVEVPALVVPLIGADARCAVVAAASVLAKVVRDRMMRDEAEHFPAYHFERNKGYPSPLHQTALRGYGLSSIHRRSWAFVEDLPWRRSRVPSLAALARTRAEELARARAEDLARARQGVFASHQVGSER